MAGHTSYFKQPHDLRLISRTVEFCTKHLVSKYLYLGAEIKPNIFHSIWHGIFDCITFLCGINMSPFQPFETPGLWPYLSVIFVTCYRVEVVWLMVWRTVTDEIFTRNFKLFFVCFIEMFFRKFWWLILYSIIHIKMNFFRFLLTI